MPRSIYALVPLVGAIGALAAADSWVFGDSLFYLGPPSSNAAIVKATYSITPPDVPSGYEYSGSSDAPWVSVWVGASASESSNDYNLYQPLFNWSPDQESQYVVQIAFDFVEELGCANMRQIKEVALPALISGVLQPARSLQVRNMRLR